MKFKNKKLLIICLVMILVTLATGFSSQASVNILAKNQASYEKVKAQDDKENELINTEKSKYETVKSEYETVKDNKNAQTKKIIKVVKGYLTSRYTYTGNIADVYQTVAENIKPYCIDSFYQDEVKTMKNQKIAGNGNIQEDSGTHTCTIIKLYCENVSFTLNDGKDIIANVVAKYKVNDDINYSMINVYYSKSKNWLITSTDEKYIVH